MDLVSKILIHKLGPNHVGIGSRTERSRVLKIAVNYVIFSCFLWVAPQKNLKRKPIQANEILGRTLQQSLMSSINLEQASRYLSSHFLNVAAFSRLIKISSCGYPFISTFNL